MAPSLSSVIVGLASVVLVGMIVGDPSRLQAQSPATVEVGPFSTANPNGPWPDGWKPLTFPKIPQHTTYSLVLDGDRVAVKATSRASSSGYTKEILIDPKEYPIVQWRWKVSNTLKAGDVTRKEGDDYPARIYVTFQYESAKVGLFGKAKYEAAKLIYGRYPPLGAINYIWESRAPVGTAVPNPYTEQVHMIVVESGSAKLNTWTTEERNVYEDYKRAFGAEPPMISGVAIMTDTDNTGESAEAYYGDIVFKKKGT
ncbi:MULTISPECIES: DUF3047 domain-containing protein [Nitrospira]|uniref:DUF3047 domain-containing protein n=2 Tax=Nitrospira TaxID=1234 RepID=A0AA86MZ61_9BACT|nr:MULTISPECIES: DUF3047 domain-containing protein [Nitrospira]CAE6731719.1 conserved hypothetical protein [Nitrospira defluvii]CAI4031734.1 hypothetical protein DNFV4_02153 [Nitrospira tepida]